MDNYILDEQLNPVQVSMEESFLVSGEEDWEDKRRMALTTFTSGERVSTVFLAIDHNHGEGTPIVFETLAFDKDGHGLDETMSRYVTFDEAILGHKRMVERICMNSLAVLVIENEYIKKRPPKLPEPPRKLEYCKESNNEILRKRFTKRIKT